MGIEVNEISAKARGGTELMMERLANSFPSEYLDKFQIIPSRVGKLDESKYRIYWCHDLAEDPATNHLANGGWQRFHKIVFVSYWQRDSYIRRYQIPYSKTVVIQNAIVPIDGVDVEEKICSFKTKKIIYHTTPHRGLEILVPVFEKLHQKWGNKIELDVYSSFKIYNWDERDEPYKPLFEKIQNHPAMNYYGYQPNDVVREALKEAVIFAYPSIWQETSCIALMEAMSAGCICVHPDYAALPETAANLTAMYNYHENPSNHAGALYGMLDTIIDALNKENNHEVVKSIITKQKTQLGYANMYYNWDLRKLQWDVLFQNVLKMPLELEAPKGPVFTYQV